MYKFNDLPETIFGKPKQLYMKDHKEMMEFARLLTIQEYDIKKMYVSKLYSEDKSTDEEKAESKRAVMALDFMGMIVNDTFDTKKVFIKLFNFFYESFNEDVFLKINTDSLLELRQLIIDVNCLPFKQKNPNDEIAYFDAMRDSMNDINVSIESIYYSIWSFMGACPDGILMYDFYNLFKRMQIMKSYDTNVLFKTVDTKNKISIHPWFADEKTDVKIISMEELKNNNKI